MICPSCLAGNDAAADVCFKCGKGLFALTEGSSLGGRYEILGLLGRGGMGIVYKARDRELDEIVAVKVLRPTVVGSIGVQKRFLSEIKLARKVSHRNVCRIHEYAREGPLGYLVMEFIDGVDLKQTIRAQGPLPPEDAFDVAQQIAEALEAIHEMGIVHRDLKSSNIMRDGQGRAKLMDFGIAKALLSEATTGLTGTGNIVGTVEYMSPEQARGETLDGRSDLYALGVVIFEMFTGRIPFESDTPVAMLMKQINEPPPLEGPGAARIPAPAVAVLRTALAKRPEARFPSARRMWEALEAARSESLEGATLRLPKRPESAGLPQLELAAPDHTLVPTQTDVRVLERPVPPPTPARTVRRWTPPRPRPTPAAKRRLWPWLGAFAVAVAAVVTVAWPTSSKLEAPGSPMSGSEPGEGGIRLSWQGVPTAATYHVVLGINAWIRPARVDRDGITDPTLVIQELPPGTYYWQVAAVGPGGVKGPLSDVASFTVVAPPTTTTTTTPKPSVPRQDSKPDLPEPPPPRPPKPSVTLPPGPPVGLSSVQGLGEGAIRLSWQRVPSAVSYHVILGVDPSIKPARVDRDGITDSNLVIQELRPGTYYWQVAAVGPGGAEGPLSDVARFTVVEPSVTLPPGPPVGLSSVQGLGEGAIRLSWQRVPSAVSYHVVLGVDPSIRPARVDRDGITDSNLVIQELRPGTYYWRVAAVGPGGVEGPPSDVARFTVSAPPRPESPVPRMGFLQIVVRPWAKVTVDGRVVGNTPLEPLSLSPGEHIVVLSNPGYRPLQKKVTIQSGTEYRLEVDLAYEAFPQ